MSDISSEDMQRAVISALQEYSQEIDDIMQDEIETLAKEIVKTMKSDDDIPVRTGKYKRSFFMKKIASGKGFKRVAVANRVSQLTHLLEHGHLVNGIRTRAYPHWEKAQKMADTLPERLERRISNGIR